MKKIRSFIAVEISDAVREKIDLLIKDLKKIDAEIKWVKPENLHITIKFLGYLTPKELEEVKITLQKAHQGIAPFEVEHKGAGWFPPGKSPRVFWIGIEGELKKLALQIEEALAPRPLDFARGSGQAKKGIQRENRPFSGHLTIGRVKKGVNKDVKEKVARLKDWSAGKMLVDRVIVYKSTLTRQGPIYEKIMEELL